MADRTCPKCGGITDTTGNYCDNCETHFKPGTNDPLNYNADSIHNSAFCNVKGCEEEATKWFEITPAMAKSFNGTNLTDTFYLCPDHYDQLVDDNEEINLLNPATGEIFAGIEIAEYSCAEDCDVCNG
jgi:hypothetical protein